MTRKTKNTRENMLNNSENTQPCQKETFFRIEDLF